jgi:FkbM family methyltransferase
MLNYIKRILIKEEILGRISKNYISKYLPDNPIVLEAGAHIGKDTFELSKLFKKGYIHAFEPVPSILEQLKLNTSALTNVSVYPLALSDKDGYTEMFISSGRSDGSSSIMQPKEHLNIHPDVHFDKKITVPTVTIDTWAQSNNISKIDFLWLDLQGHELAVLKASPTILKTVKVIHTEVSLVENYEGNPIYKDLKDWLHTWGFKVAKEAIAWSDGGNVLFIK